MWYVVVCTCLVVFLGWMGRGDWVRFVGRFLGGGCTRSFCVAERALYLYLYSGFLLLLVYFNRTH